MLRESGASSNHRPDRRNRTVCGYWIIRSPPSRGQASRMMTREGSCTSTPIEHAVNLPKRQQREDHMRPLHHRSLRRLLLAGTVMLAAAPAVAADVTPERLTNPEPGNWLMNHRTYDAQRYSPLDKINKDNVKSLKLAYAVAIGGTAANENLQSTPLAE